MGGRPWRKLMGCLEIGIAGMDGGLSTVEEQQFRRYMNSSIRQTKKQIRDYLKFQFHRNISVFVSRSMTITNHHHVEKAWVIYIWPYGTTRAYGTVVHSLDPHTGIEIATDAIADYNPEWLKFRWTPKKQRAIIENKANTPLGWIKTQ
jgi:hypothetical protein